MNQAYLSQFNAVQKENDKLYREAIRDLGISEACFWILYSLRDEPAPLTQSRVVELCGYPAQTVNSALKKLETEGYLTLYTGQDKRKKILMLTEAGEILAQKTADKVMALESAAICNMTDDQQQQLLTLLQEYTRHLAVQFHSLKETK